MRGMHRAIASGGARPPTRNGDSAAGRMRVTQSRCRMSSSMTGSSACRRSPPTASRARSSIRAWRARSFRRRRRLRLRTSRRECAMSEASTATGFVAPSRANLARLRAILGGSAGNLVEWYDWFAYASFAFYFAPVFFPAGDQTAQLLKTAAGFAVGFFARPVGAWIMGLYADRAGRRVAMAVSVGLMCFGSLVIALTPGYAAIGGAAPIILLVARVLQGLSVGGEYGASATY